jgi:hypothetical protein
VYAAVPVLLALLRVRALCMLPCFEMWALLSLSRRRIATPSSRSEDVALTNLNMSLNRYAQPPACMTMRLRACMRVLGTIFLYLVRVLERDVRPPYSHVINFKSMTHHHRRVCVSLCCVLCSGTCLQPTNFRRFLLPAVMKGASKDLAVEHVGDQEGRSTAKLKSAGTKRDPQAELRTASLAPCHRQSSSVYFSVFLLFIYKYVSDISTNVLP